MVVRVILMEEDILWSRWDLVVAIEILFANRDLCR